MIDWFSVLNFPLNTLSTFFCTSAVLVFLHCFYDRAFLWNKKKALILLLVGFLESFVSTSNNPMVFLASIAVVTFAATYDYRGKFSHSLKFLLVYAIVEVCATYLVINASCIIFPEISADLLADMTASLEGSTNLSVTTAPLVVYYGMWMLNILFYGSIFFYIYFKMYKRGILIQCGQREMAFASIYPVLIFGFTVALAQYGVDSDYVRVLLTIMSVLFALMFPVFIYYVRISKNYQDRNALQQNYIQTQLSQFQQYKLGQEETARFRHDIRNNLLCVNDLLQSGKTEEAKEYLHDLLKVSENLRMKYVTGDDMLNCILGAKSSTLAVNKIRFQLDGVLAGGLNWKPIDICTVFANALDNAIEACLQLPEEQRYINMTIRSAAQYWFVTIENPTGHAVDPQQLFRKSGNYSSKEEGNHGMGTFNMRRTVERYHGHLNARCEGGQFTLEIMLSKNDN